MFFLYLIELYEQIVNYRTIVGKSLLLKVNVTQINCEDR